MSDRRRRWSPESSRRRRKDRRVSREQLAMEEAAAAGPRSMAPENSYSSASYPYPSQAQGPTPSSSFQQQQTAPATDQQPLPPITLRSNDDVGPSMSTAAPMPMPPPQRDYGRARDSPRNRHGSGSSSDMSLSSSSSSSYLEISRWYPNYGRAGGVFKTFFGTPSEHKQKVRRRRSGGKKKGIFGFGHNSSSSSVNSDMAYGMGFVRKPKSRNFSPRGEPAANVRETSDGKPPRLQRRQTDEEILEIGRKLAKVARDSQDVEDMRAAGRRPAGQNTAAASFWNRFYGQSSGGHAGPSRGLPPSTPQRHDTSSSDDEEWESASEDESSSSSSDENSGLAYGEVVEFDHHPPPPPPRSSVSRQSTIAAFRPPDRKPSAVDPRLFGPVNSLRGIVNTPCGYGDRESAYTAPGLLEQRRTSTAESASIEARPMQTVYPVQTSDPEIVEAARLSDSVVSAQASSSRNRSQPTGRPDPVQIQAPKPIAPFQKYRYEEERIRNEPPESPERRRINPADNKTFAETALVGAGVAAIGAAILSDRDKGKDKDRAFEERHHEQYGHDDHREDVTKVEDSHRAKELALEKEIERLEKVLSQRNKAREQRKRDSKRDSGTRERQDTDPDADREPRRRGRDSTRAEPDNDYDRYGAEQPESSRRVSEPNEQPAVVDDVQNRTVENQSLPSSSGIDVFQFQVPDDAFRSRDSPLRPATPLIIDVTPAPSPEPEEMERRSRRDSFEDEMRDARHIYEESTKSTAPISAVDMAAAIAATEHSDRYDEPERGRTNAKQRDAVQEEADRYYHARRMAEREVRSRSRSTSPERSVVGKYGSERGADIPRIVTPPEMMQKPQKNEYSEPNADIMFDHTLSPKELVFFRPTECPVRDPSAERPRPVLTLVIPTPAPTPSPESEKKRAAARAAEPALQDAPDIVIGPKGDVVVVDVTQSPESKRVSWGPSETKQYEVESPERSRERPSQFSEEPQRSSKGASWSTIAAAVAGAGVGAGAAAALSGDDELERFEHKERVEDIGDDVLPEFPHPSPPRDRKVLPKEMPSRVLDEEPERFEHKERVKDIGDDVLPEFPHPSPPRDRKVLPKGTSSRVLDEEPERFEHKERVEDIGDDILPEFPHPSPPRDRKVLPKGISSRVLDEEPEDVPPAPGPKPASPRNSQVPGAFADDLDFAATLAAGLQDTGFDPNIVIDNAAYRRRDSPPGSNDDTDVYIQPIDETLPDLGGFDFGIGAPVREPGHVIGEVAETPASEKEPPLNDLESTPPGRQPRLDEAHTIVRDDTDPIEQPVDEFHDFSREQQREMEKAASAAQLAEEEERAAQPAETAHDEREEAPESQKFKKSSRELKKTSAGWDDADTPVNDRRVSASIDEIDDVKDLRTSEDTWEEPRGLKRSESDFQGYDLPQEIPVSRRDRRREERRRSGENEPLDEDVDSMDSDRENDDRLNGGGRSSSSIEGPIVSAPAPEDKRNGKLDRKNSKEGKKSSGGGFWGRLKGSNGVDGDKQSKKGSAGTHGAGAGFAGAALGAAIAAGSLPFSSDAAEAPPVQEEPHVVVDVDQPSAYRADDTPRQEPLVLEDPEIIPRVIIPAIDPQYGDLLPLPPSPGKVNSTEFHMDDNLPPLPDSRPATPPGQERSSLRERSESSQKRPAHATHSRRRSANETPTKSPSQTAVPIQFRMGPRASVPPQFGLPRTPPTSHPSPSAPSQETFTNTKRQSRPLSWDRPKAWDGSKEIRPLYLLERSRGGDQEHDDIPEATPLPPSRESPAPEPEHDEKLQASPIFIDAAAAQAASPLGSEASTPKGLREMDFESPGSAKDFEYIPPRIPSPQHAVTGLQIQGRNPELPSLEAPSQSSLSESAYATPFESPGEGPEVRPSLGREESTESTLEFQDALDAPADDEDTDPGTPKRRRKGKTDSPQTPVFEHPEEQRKRFSFPSAFSRFPSATVAGVSALLGRGRRDEDSIDIDIRADETQTQGPLPESPDQTAEKEIPPTAEVELASPVGSADQGQSPTASPSKSLGDTPHSTIDAGDASLPNESHAAPMQPERSLSIEDIQATEGVVHDVSGGGADSPAFEPQVIEEFGGLSPSLLSHTSELEPTRTSPAEKVEDMDPIPETPADTVDWIAEAGFEKDENKQNVLDDSPAPATAGPNIAPHPDVQNEPLPTAFDETSSAWEPVATSPALDQPGEQSQGATVADPSTSSETKGKEREDSPHDLDLEEEGLSKGLTHEPEAMPIASEGPASPGAHSQDEPVQVGGREMKSAATSRRLRSSRSSMSSHKSMDEYMSSDAAQSGEDGPRSPRIATSSGFRTTGKKYKKTRSLRSSRRSSMASSQGSGRENEPASIEGTTEQPTATVPEQSQVESVESHIGTQLEVETLEPAKPTTIDDFATSERGHVEEPIHNQPETLEEPTQSPDDENERPISNRPATVEEPSTVQSDVADESAPKEAEVVEEPPATQPDDFEKPVSEQPETVTESNIRPTTPVREEQEEDFWHTPNAGQDDKGEKEQGASPIENLDKSPEPEVSADELVDAQEDTLPENSMLGDDEVVKTVPEELAEDISLEQAPRDLAEPPVQSSESGKTIEDGLQQQVEAVPSTDPEKQAVEPSSPMEENDATRDVASDDSPVCQIEQISGQEQPTSQLTDEEALAQRSEDLPKVQQQESELASIPLDAESRASPVEPEGGKQKRRDSSIADEALRSFEGEIPAEPEPISQPVETPSDTTSPVREDTQLEQLPLESEDTHLYEVTQPQVTNVIDAQEISESLEPGVSADEPSKPSKPTEYSQPLEQIVSPIDDIDPATIPSVESTDSAFKVEDQPEEAVHDDDIARQEADTALIHQEEDELAKLRHKSHPSKSQKARIKALKANAERRARESGAAKDKVTGPSHDDEAGSKDPASHVIEDGEDVPQSQAEEASRTLPLDSDYAAESFKSQHEETSQPQVEEAAPSEVEVPSLQPEVESATKDLPQDQPDIAHEVTDLPQAELGDSSPISLEVASPTETPKAQEKDIVASPTMAGSELPDVTELQQQFDIESPVTSLKSQRDEEGQEGIISDDNDQMSEIHPLASAVPDVAESRELSEPAPLPVQDSETASVSVPSEAIPVQQGQPSDDHMQGDTILNNIVPEEVARAQPTETYDLEPQAQTSSQFEQLSPIQTSFEEENIPVAASEPQQVSPAIESDSGLATVEPEDHQMQEHKSPVSEDSPKPYGSTTPVAPDVMQQQMTSVEPIEEAEGVRPTTDTPEPVEITSHTNLVSSSSQEAPSTPTTQKPEPGQGDNPENILTKESEESEKTHEETLSGTVPHIEEFRKSSSPAEPADVQASFESTENLGIEAPQSSDLERTLSVEREFEAPGSPMPMNTDEPASEAKIEDLSPSVPAVSEPERMFAEPEQVSRPGKKTDGWGFLAGAIAGAGAAMGSSREDMHFQRDEPINKDVASEHDSVPDVETRDPLPFQNLGFGDVVDNAMKTTPRDEEPLETSSRDLPQEQSTKDEATVQPEAVTQMPESNQNNQFEPIAGEAEKRASATSDLGTENFGSSGRQTPVREDIKQAMDENAFEDSTTSPQQLSAAEDHVHLPEFDSMPVDGDRTERVADQEADQPRLEESLHPQIEEEEGLASDTMPRPEIEGKIDEGSDTLIMAGGEMPEDSPESTRIQQDWPISAEQAKELADDDNDKPSLEPEILTPVEDSNLTEAFTSPTGQQPTHSDESKPVHSRTSSSLSGEDRPGVVDQHFEEDGQTRQRGSINQSFEMEPEPPMSVPETLLSEKPLEQQPVTEPGGTQKVAEQSIELPEEALSDPIIKGTPVSAKESEVTIPSEEDDSRQAIEDIVNPQSGPERQDQAPSESSIFSPTQSMETSQQESSQDDKPSGETAKIIQEQDLDRSFDVPPVPTSLPEPEPQRQQEEEAEVTAPPSTDQPMESELPKPQGMVVEETSGLTRNLSKKQRRKAKKKAASASQDSTHEPSQPQTAVAENFQPPDVPATSIAAPETDPKSTEDMTGPQPAEVSPAQDITESMEAPIVENVVAGDDWDALLGHKDPEETEPDQEPTRDVPNPDPADVLPAPDIAESTEASVVENVVAGDDWDALLGHNDSEETEKDKGKQPASESDSVPQPAEILPAQNIAESTEASAVENVVAGDDWDALLGHKDSEETEEVKGKQPALESGSVPQTPTTEHSPVLSAEDVNLQGSESGEMPKQITEDATESTSHGDHRSAGVNISEAEDDWDALLGHKDSEETEKDKGKQLVSGPVSVSQTPTIEDSTAPAQATEVATEPGHVDHRSAEVYIPEAEAQETLTQPFEEPTGRGDHRSAEMYIPEAQDPLEQTTKDASEPVDHADHRSAEVYVPEAQEPLQKFTEDANESTGHVDHRSAEIYIPEAQEEQNFEESTSRGGHRSAEMYVPEAQETPEQTGEAVGEPTGHVDHRSAEVYVPVVENDAEGVREMSDSGGAQIDRQSSDIRDRELQRKEPSPDIWDNEDYFKPKPDDLGEPAQEAFNRVDINPAVALGLNSSSNKRMQDSRPLVGLGLIHRHSSIFREDDGHIPRLLTMASENVSTESVAIQDEPSQPDASAVMDSGSAQEDIDTSHEDPIASASGPSKETEKNFSFIKSESKQQANAPSAQESTAPDLDVHERPATASTRPPTAKSQETATFGDVKGAPKKGGVAALAEKFGGTRKSLGKSEQLPTFVDKGSPREGDVGDEPAMWERAEGSSAEDSLLDVDSGDLWGVPDTTLENVQVNPDVHPVQGPPTTSQSRETQFGNENVSGPRSQQPYSDAGEFTPQVSEQTTPPEARFPLEEPVELESPATGQHATVELPPTEPHSSVELPDNPTDLNTDQMIGPLTDNTNTTFNDSWNAPQDPPSPGSPSPASEQSDSPEGPSVLPIEETDDNVLIKRPSVVDFRRSVSRGLPPVQEEPHEEEAEAEKQDMSFSSGAVTPDINRDSGVATDSSILPRFRQYEKAQQQRDSGVHMRDSPGTSPKLRGTRAFSPQPARLSQPSLDSEGAKLEEIPSQRSSPVENETQRQLMEATPILEAQEPPVTPEPQKSRSMSPKKYPNLGPSPGKATAAVAGGAALLTPEPATSPAQDQRSVSDKTGQPRATPESLRRVVSNTGISRIRTPEPLNLRSQSPSLYRHSGTPPLRSRRTRSGDLRSLGQSSTRSLSHSDLDLILDKRASPAGGGSPASAANNPAHRPTTPTRSPTSSDLRRATTPAAAQTNNSPVANEGRVRAKDMADVYDGFGEGRMGSPRSPTRPHSMRRRQSMQVLELESRVEQLIAENRALQEARSQAQLHTTSQASSTLAERDTEIEALKQSLEFLRKEVQRLTEVNEGLNSAIQSTAVQYDDRYRLLESQHADATRELHEHRSRQDTDAQINETIEQKDAEIRSLREELEATKEHIREMQARILATKPIDSDFLRIKDVDYFDHRCQQLCSHVQQWVLRFSKFSDMRACRLTSELNDEKIIDRLDNAVLDGSNVDHYLNDRVKRRDVFMSVTMTMIWEFVFTRYLFGMDREQRQKLKQLEKLLLEVGPPQAVRQWRAVTLTLLSKRDPFKDQRVQDTEAVVQAVFQTLSMILPPPSNLEDQIQNQLRKVMREAVDLSIEMRTQRAEYMMLPPLQPEYDANGDLAEPHPFNAALMNERGTASNRTAEELEAEGAIVRVVLFPLVVKKGDDTGVGDDEIVVCPAQVIVSRPRSKSRQSFRAPESDAGGVSLLRGGSPSTGRSRSNVSMRDVEGMEGAI